MKVNTYEEVFGKKLTIRDLVDGFQEDTKTGKVVAFRGKLNVRPPYQREFVYENQKRNKVIDSIMKGYPLNIMYWAKCHDGNYELMDGQQRTLSICKFYKGGFSIDVEIAGTINPVTFQKLASRTNDFLDYPLTVYICDGTEDEKLAWFQIINIAGVKLTSQEMRNAIYNSPWVTDAKKYFSRIDSQGFAGNGHTDNGHPNSDYIDVIGVDKSENEKAVVRQKLLEIVLSWATDAENVKSEGRKKLKIENYMLTNIDKPNAIELCRYYEDIIEWVKNTFPTYNKLMKGIEWGYLYNRYHNNDNKEADSKVQDILRTEEISNEKAVYEAVLSGNIKLLNARNFTKEDKKWAYSRQKHRCTYCKKEYNIEDMQGDHIIPWSKGGKTTRDNLQMLCKECNIKKSNYDVSYTPWDNKDYEKFKLEEQNNK